MQRRADFVYLPPEAHPAVITETSRVGRAAMLQCVYRLEYFTNCWNLLGGLVRLAQQPAAGMVQKLATASASVANVSNNDKRRAISKACLNFGPM